MDEQNPFANARAIEIAADLRDAFGPAALAQAAERRDEAGSADDPDGTAFWQRVCTILVGHDRIARQRAHCRA